LRRVVLLLICLGAGAPAAADDKYFYASDGARLHYAETGPAGAPVLLFVPGWTMPGWIFAAQEQAFDAKYRVVLFDPRGQGESEVTAGGYDQNRRGQDIGELVALLPGKVVVIGWSLGVLDTLAWVHQGGSAAKLAGLVLIDNSVGERPAPVAGPRTRRVARPALDRADYMRRFVAGMFRTPQPPEFLARLTAATLVTPPEDAAKLLAYPVPRTYWKAAIMATDVPVFYAVRPGLQGQAENLLADRPHTSIAVFPGAGHALFVDDAKRFDLLMGNFLETIQWR
jgi:microsomal epoxide hydrolase